MAAKTETSSPSKLTPGERLARKRAAARLRQQRCRARKRQAMLEQRRQQNEVRQSQTSQDSKSELIQEVSHVRPRVFQASGPKEVPTSSSSEPIYNCVSFDSQRSFEDAQRPHGMHVTKMHSAEPHTVSLTSTPLSSKAVEIIGMPQDQSEETLVPEEEAAIAAMLSLKTGPERRKVVHHVREKESSHHHTSRPPVPRNPHSAKFRYYRSWEPRRYESYEYGRSHYYKMPLPPVPPPPPPPPHYRYYPTYQRYGRCEYD